MDEEFIGVEDKTPKKERPAPQVVSYPNRKQVPSVTGGLAFTQIEEPKKENEFRKIPLDNYTKEEFKDRFPLQYISDDYQKKLTEEQTVGKEIFNTIGHVVNNFIGGTISSIGSAGAIIYSVSDEINNKDADFHNFLTDFGDNLKQQGIFGVGGQKSAPVYSEEPGKSWDVKHLSWWLHGVESAASTLEFLVGAGAVTKGFKVLGELPLLEKAIIKAGGNVEKLRNLIPKIGAAGFMRNAEAMQDSYQTKLTIKSNLLDEWEKNPDTFEKLKDSDIAKELSNEGREVNQENLANFISSKSAWRNYIMDIPNIAFDYLQLAPMFKGNFNPSTRLGKLGTPTSVLKAQNLALGTGASKISKFHKAWDYLNPVLSPVGRSLSEGVEEGVNFIAQEEGKNYASQLQGKQTPNFSDRIVNYLKSGDFYENMFWGVAGGAIAQGAMPLVGKMYGLAKGIKSNTDNDYRILEIEQRANLITKASEEIKKAIDNKEVSDEDKKDTIKRIKSELALDLGVRAAQVGNVDLLLKQMESPEFKKMLVEKGVAEEGDVEKAVAKSVDDVLTAEKLYIKHYNSFQTANTNDVVRHRLMDASITSDFLIHKTTQEKGVIGKDLENLKVNDAYLKTTQEPNVESTIQLRALEGAKEAVAKFLKDKKLNREEILTNRGKTELENIDAEIKKIRNIVGDKEASLDGLNPDILTKETQALILNGVNNLNAERVTNLRKPETVKKYTEQHNEAVKKQEETDVKDFKETVDKEINDGKHTSTTLKELRKQNKNSKARTTYLDDKIKILSNSEEKKRREAEVEKAKTSPVKESNEFESIPAYEVTQVDESKLKPDYKADIDKHFANRNIGELNAYAGDLVFETDPLESSYARNKLQELRNEINDVQEVSNINNEIVEVEEGEFSEAATSELSSTGKSIDDIFNVDAKEEPTEKKPFEFLRKINNQDSTRAFILEFGLNYQDYFQVQNGNILIKDEYVPLVKTLMDKDFGVDSEVELKIDKDNTFYKEHKDNANRVPIGVFYKGQRVAYLGTINGIEKEIRKAKESKNDQLQHKLELDLIEIQKIRNTIGLNDKGFKTKVTLKGNGTIISRGTKPTALRSVKNIFNYKDFYYLEKGGKTTLINGFGKTIGLGTQYRQGVLYGRLDSANGTPIPVPLFIDKLNLTDAKVVQDSIYKIMQEVDKDSSSFETLDNLENKVREYIKVDTSKQIQEGQNTGFRIFKKHISKDDKVINGRIEFSFYSNNNRFHAVIRNDAYGVPFFNVVKKTKDGKDEWIKEGEKLYTKDIFDSQFLDVLQKKYYAIDFRKLKEEKYVNYLVNNEIIKTDVAQVVDKSGKVISNLFGFNNDFDLFISSNLGEEKKETTEETGTKEKKGSGTQSTDDLIDLLRISNPFDKEVKTAEEYKDKYSVYTYISTTGSNTVAEILKNPLSPEIKETATWVKSFINKSDVALKIDKNLDKDTFGKYDPETNTIYLNPKALVSEVNLQEFILHEISHSLTAKQLIEHGKFESNGEYKLKSTAPTYIKNFVDAVTKDYNIITQSIQKRTGKTLEQLIKEDKSKYYGLSNLAEFIAEVSVNPQFRSIVAENTDIGFWGRLYNQIVWLLNKAFGLKINDFKAKKVINSLNAIKNYIKTNITYAISSSIVDPYSLYRKFDFAKGDLSIEDVYKLTKYFESVILADERKSKTDLTEDKTKEEFNREKLSGLVTRIREALPKLKDKLNDTQKGNIDKVETHLWSLINLSIDNLNREFKQNSFYDVDKVDDDLVSKEWEDSKAKEISSQDTIVREIKKFVKTVPHINAFDIEFNDDGTVKNFNVTKDNKFGTTQYIDFNTIYPYLSRNLIGAKTGAEIIERLESISRIQIPNSELPFGSFAWMSKELQKDNNLLTQFVVNLGGRTLYDSQVIFFTDKDNGLEVRVDNENKKNNPQIALGNEFNEGVTNVIDFLKENPDRVDDFKDRISALQTNITILGNTDFKKNSDTIASKLFEYSNELGIGVSFPAILDNINSLTKFGDLTLQKRLDFIKDEILNFKIGNSFGNLNELAKVELPYRIDKAENVVLSIDGKPLYALRTTNFLSNFFDFIHSKSQQGLTSVDDYFKALSTIPEFEYSNWMWNEENKGGIFNYEVVDGRKKVTTINKTFLEDLDFHNFNGAKEIISKQVQKYEDYTDDDWKLINMIMYYKGTKKKSTKLYPILIPSDSSTFYHLEAPFIPLKDSELVGTEISQNSSLFKALLNVNLQEVRRIQQAYQFAFELDSKGDLKVKEGLKDTDLIAWYHYDAKNIIYNDNGTINLQETLLKDGSPTGKAFGFHNMRVSEDKIKLNKHLFVNEVSSDILEILKKDTSKFASKIINEGLSDYRKLESKLKHDVKTKHKTYEGKVAEYVLNNYLTNVEQTNYLQGNLSYYKDEIDASKRHKQTNAPGEIYYPEAMKIQRKNGSWANGVDFEVSIIKDVNRSSKYYNQLLEAVGGDESIVEAYKNINAGDAQGYMTLDRMEQLFRGRAKFDTYYEKLFKSIRSGKQIERNDLKRLVEGLKTLQPTKNFYYGLHHNIVTNTLVPKQLKYSLIPLIPQLVANTDLEKLMNTMETKGIDEVVFESGSKVGTGKIYKVTNSEGKLDDDLLSKLESTSYQNKNLYLQLEIPEHIVDEQNRLATQISKLIIANIPDDTEYDLEDRKVKGSELKEYYFKIWSAQVNQSASQLLSDLNIKFDEEVNDYVIDYSKLSDVLKEEINNRGLSENYKEAIEPLNGRFTLPLFSNNMNKKWQAILTSLFTNRILRQKLPGLSAVQASSLFTETYEQSKYKDITGIQWLDEKPKSSKNIVEVYQGKRAIEDDRKINYYALTESEAKDYGNVKKYSIDLTGFLFRNINGKDNNEYWNLIDEFNSKTGKYFDILDNTKKGIQVQNEFFNFLEEKGYKGFSTYSIEDIKKIQSSEDVENYDNKYVISFIKQTSDKKVSRELKVFDENGVKVVECLVGRWNSKFFKDGVAININDIPTDILDIIGYRIPTDAKHSMIMLKVVGFLPEESKGLIITPDDIITQTGADFDIDKLFLTTQNIYQDKDGKLGLIKYENSTNYDNKKLKDLYDRVSGNKLLKKITKEVEDAYKFNEKDIASKLSKMIMDNQEDLEFFQEELANEILENPQSYKLIEKVNKFSSFEEWKKLTPEERVPKSQRDNVIFSIYKSILTNKEHIKEMITPSGFEGFIDLANWFKEVNRQNDKDINVLTDRGQRLIRKRNIDGRNLKGISANLNAFGAIAQHTKMELSSGFRFAIKVEDNKSELDNRYGGNIEFKEGYANIDFKGLGYAPDGSFKNAEGKLITEEASQGLAASVDVTKTPTFNYFNATTYTYPLMHSMILAGVPIRISGLFIGQPIMKNLNDYYFEQKSILGDTSGKEVEITKRWYQTILLHELMNSGVKIKSKNIKGLLERRKKYNIGISSKDPRYLLYISREDTEKILEYNPNEVKFFNQEELENNIKEHAKGYTNLPVKEKIAYLKKQLIILEHFGEYRKNSQTIQDILRVTKTDAIGAGSTLSVTNVLLNDINKLKNNRTVLIEGKPAIQKIYPKLLGKKGESVYLPLETYLNKVNALSYSVLSPLFMNYSESFRQVEDAIKEVTKRPLTESYLENLHKYLNSYVLQGFSNIETLPRTQILGINSTINNDINIDLDTFKTLSTANKVSIMKEIKEEYLRDNPLHILNFLNPRLRRNDITDNGYHKIDISFYKNEFTDDTLVQNLVILYKEGDSFEKELARSLIEYNIVTDGLSFRLNSFTKIIPNEILSDMGLGDYLYHKNNLANDGMLFTDTDVMHKFFRNNWGNNDVVPTIRKEISAFKEEKDGIISIDKVLRTKLFSKEQRNAPYILVNDKLYLKVEAEEGSPASGLPMIYYTQVSKLGKDGLFEYTDKSMFAENNTNFNEDIIIDEAHRLEQGAKVEDEGTGLPSLIRHGETLQDENNQNSGWNDIALSPKGVAQAKVKGEEIKKAGITKIIASTIERAKETAKIASKISRAKVVYSPLLKSWHIGDLEGKPKSDFDEEYYVRHPDVVVPNGETFNQFKERVIQAMNDIVWDDKTIILAHSKVIKVWRAIQEFGGWNSHSIMSYLNDDNFKDEFKPSKSKPKLDNTKDSQTDEDIKNCGY